MRLEKAEALHNTIMDSDASVSSSGDLVFVKVSASWVLFGIGERSGVKRILFFLNTTRQARALTFAETNPLISVAHV